MHLGLIGYGTIARALIAQLPAGCAEKITVLVREGALPAAKAHAEAQPGGPPLHFVTTPEALAQASCDLGVECAGHAAVRDIAPMLLCGGTSLVLASLGALADETLHQDLTRAAQQGNSRLILPHGAIGGLDILATWALAGPVQVTYRGTKPPAAWKGSPAESAVDLDALTEPHVFFSGTGRAAALAYPKNANVVAALALAGAGFDQLQVQLCADPQATSNQHRYEVTSPLGRYEMQIDNAMSQGNARTSAATIYSLLRQVLNHRA